MSRKKVSVYKPDLSDEAVLDRVEQDLRWYNTTPYAHLTVAAFVPAGPWGELVVARLVDAFRAGKATQKSDPQFWFYLAPGAGAALYDLLEGYDTRLPRLSVCLVIRADSAHGILEELQALSRLVRARLLDCRAAFFPLGTEELAAVRGALDEAMRSPDLERLLAAFPVIEVGFEARESGEALEAAVAELWSRYPRLVESLNAGVGGYVRRFYALKEAWHLSRITGQPMRRPAGEKAPDAATALQLAAFDRAFLENHASLDWYARCHHRAASAILEFDLDSIADTYECQSPVFVDGRWILDRDRLAGQTDPVAARNAALSPSSTGGA